MALIFAVDTGGTFTDIAAFDLDTGDVSYAKALTTYGDLVDGVMQCVEEAGADLCDALLAKHGTTLVINTLLQRNGARAALVTTKGFRDTLELGRGNRTSPFRIDYRRTPPLIPREVLFGNPTKESPQISPDGRRLAYLAPVDGVLNVWVGDTQKGNFRPITADRDRGVRIYFWGFDNETILYLQDVGGDEN